MSVSAFQFLDTNVPHESFWSVASVLYRCRIGYCKIKLDLKSTDLEHMNTNKGNCFTEIVLEAKYHSLSLEVPCTECHNICIKI